MTIATPSPSPPDWLSPAARTIWADVTRQIAIHPLDCNAVTRYCETVAQSRHLSESSDPIVQRISRRLQRQAAALAHDLGIER